MTRPADGQPAWPLPDDASIPARIPTLGTYLRRWLAEAVERNLEPATYANYETMARLYVSPALGSVRLDQLRTQDVQAWLDGLRHVCQCCAQGTDAARPAGRQRCCAIGACCHQYPGRRTIQAARDTLRAALSDATTGELVPRNVAAYATVPSPRRCRPPGPAWSAAEASRFLASAGADGDPFFAAYILVLVNALSKAEVLGLTWSSTDLDREELVITWQLQRVGKQLIHKKRDETEGSDADRVLPMPDLCAAALRLQARKQNAAREQAGARWQDSDLVFTTWRGTPIEPRTFDRSFDARCAKAGVRRIPVRDTRRTCAQILATLDVHPEMATRILGRAKITMTTKACAQVSDKVTRAALNKIRASLDSRPHAEQNRP